MLANKCACEGRRDRGYSPNLRASYGEQYIADTNARAAALTYSDFVLKGFLATAHSARGDKVEVRVTGNGVYVHVDSFNGDLGVCTLLGEKLNKKIEQRVKELHAGDIFGGFNAVTKSSGIGRGQEAAEAEDEAQVVVPVESTKETLRS